MVRGSDWGLTAGALTAEGTCAVGSGEDLTADCAPVLSGEESHRSDHALGDGPGVCSSTSELPSAVGASRELPTVSITAEPSARAGDSCGLSGALIGACCLICRNLLSRS